jgi:Flp pilus assembly protein TadG
MLQAMRKRIARRRLLALRVTRRFARKEDGAAAIEFGIVVLPFMMLVFAIMETAMVFFAGQTLETAVADSSRLIMTGQAQTKGMNQAAFKEAVCARVFGLFNCASGLKVDVKTYKTWAEIDPKLPIGTDGKFQDSMGYQPGGAGDIVVVRLFYQWPIYTSFAVLMNMSGQPEQRLLASAMAFRNEPFGTPAPPSN